MKRQFMRFFLVCVAISQISINANASSYGGKITLKYGETVVVDLPYPYSYYMEQYGTPNSFYWTASNNVISVRSRYRTYCTIYGNRVGTCTLNYMAGYVVGWQPETIDLDIDIEVVSADSGGGTGGGTGSGSNNEETWDKIGNYDISWYSNNQSEFTLTTDKELAGLAYLVNNGYAKFSGKTIKLGANISLDGKKWVTIGVNDFGDLGGNEFLGTFDGQGYTISGLSIGANVEKQIYFGFFGHLNEATVKNLTLRGEVNVNEPNMGGKNASHCIGGLAGSAYLSEISNVRCEMPITYTRGLQESGAYGKIDIGGVVGSASGCSISYCSHFGDMLCKEWLYSVGYCPWIGGIVGNAYDSTIKYCEHISSLIKILHPYDTNTNLRAGGLVGTGASSISYSRAITDFYLSEYGPYYIQFRQSVAGLTGESNATVINSYALVKTISTYVVSGKTMLYSGIGGYSSQSKACYSNSDISITGNMTVSHGYDGNTSYTSELMKSDAFLNEMNLYPNINEGRTIWVADENGYPCILELHKQQTEVYATGLSIDVTSISLSVGDTKQLTAMVSPNNATDKSVTWSSNNTNVVTVNSSGLVTAIAEGAATVTCKTNDGSDITASCSITVQAGTGIKDATIINSSTNTWYSLSGQRLSQPQKGINIIGGKKVVVK